MLKLYWQIVFRPYFRQIVLIAAATFVSSVAEVASIGMIVPVVGILLDSAGSATNPITSLLERFAAIIGLSPRPESYVLVGILVVTVLVVLKNGMMLAQTRWVARLMGDVVNISRERMFGAYLHAQFADMSQRGRGAIYEDISGGAGAAKNAVLQGALLLYSVTYIGMTFVLLMYISWWATLLFGCLALFGVSRMRILLEGRSRRVGKQLHELNQKRVALIVDALDGVRVLKAHSVEAITVGRLESLQARALPLQVKSRILASVPTAFFEVASVLSVLILAGLVFNFSMLGLTLPKLMAMIIGLRRMMPLAGSVNTSLIQLSSGLRKIEIIEEAINVLPREQTGDRQMPKNGFAGVQMEAVSFHYPGSTDTRVLCDVNLVFRRGHVTALVGHTGAGKTTIADLLVRLYQPVSGRIMVDGVDLSEIELVGWRRSIGYVGQNSFLFNASLRDNIVLWDGTIGIDEIERATHFAQLYDYVESLPERYDTMVGDRGLKLSGGQRQRVAVARAILHKPVMLIFDEATSALDNITEKAVHAAISRLRTSSIVILIAHRLSTVQDADQIVVLRDGRLVEQGRYEVLMASKGQFWQLYQGGNGQKLERASTHAGVPVR